MRRIANFTVDDEPLAKGGMGQIFKGTDEYGNKIAIKEILPEFANDWGIISRIKKEVEFLMKVDHPSIVKLHAAFKDPDSDCYYIVMEFVEGLNIEQYVCRNGAIPTDLANDLMLKILDAMQCVHNAHIVHRDIKPSNIMIRDNGTICLLDFGVAKDLDNNSSSTIIGSVIGTNGYMSPEQADGYAIDFRSDIYSLGCVFYYMLTGHHAFNTLSSEFETRDAILNNEFPKLSKYKSGLPDNLQKILDKATARNMTQRYSSCYEFMSDMRNGTHVSNAGHGAIPVKISIGREMCDIIISDPERKISRHHADIELKEFTGGQYYVLTDCSSNGTIVDNKRINGSSISTKANGPYPDVYLAGVAEGRLNWSQVIAEIDKKRKAIYGIHKEDGDKKPEKEDDETIKPEKPWLDQSENNTSFDNEGPNDLGESATGWLIAAFIFAIPGGLLGIIFGLIVALSKGKNSDGVSVYKYKKSNRILGLVAVGLSIFFIILWNALTFSFFHSLSYLAP